MVDLGLITWDRQTSTARSQAAHSGCWKEGGSAGTDTGVQLTLRSTRSARIKLRKIDAPNRSCPVCVCVCVCVYACIYTYVCTYVCMYMHSCMNMPVYIHTYSGVITTQRT